MEKAKLQFDIMLYERDGLWVAHCLQLDLVSAARDPGRAQEKSLRQCEAQIAYAIQNNLLAQLLRPPNEEVSARMLQDWVSGKLEMDLKPVNFNGETITLRFMQPAKLAAA